jgi:hypothetical protein
VWWQCSPLWVRWLGKQIIRGGLASDLVQTVQEVLTHFQMYGWMNIDILIALDVYNIDMSRERYIQMHYTARSTRTIDQGGVSSSDVLR